MSTHNICFGWEIRNLIFNYKLLHLEFFLQYEQLIKDIDNYLNTVTSTDSLEKLLKKLKQPKQKTSLILKLLQEVELWERTQDKFVSMLEEEYPLYRDVTTPFITAVYQVIIFIFVDLFVWVDALRPI